MDAEHWPLHRALCARVIPSVMAFYPDWYFFGVKPNSTAAAFNFVMRLGSSIADL